MGLRNFHDNGTVSCVRMEPEKPTEEFSIKNNIAVLTDEPNGFINGTHCGPIDAIKTTDVVSTNDGTTRRTLN